MNWNGTPEFLTHYRLATYALKGIYIVHKAPNQQERRVAHSMAAIGKRLEGAKLAARRSLIVESRF